MSPRELEDILEATDNLQRFTEGLTFEEFARDVKTIRASAYELGIVGEATAGIPTDVRSAHPEIPWEKMQAMRNVVFHEYFRVDVSILWQTVTQNLPPLVPLLRAMLVA